MPIKHTKTDTIPDYTQADLDAQIALGNYPPGTLISNIVLPSDWNANHTNPDIADVTGLQTALDGKQPLAAVLTNTTASYTTAINTRLANTSGTNTGDQTSVTGNAGTATALQTARTINGVSFDGTANIVVAAAGSTLTGTALASGITSSSLTSVGTITAGVWQGTAIADAYVASAATWNAKQNALTLTTTGSSGAATLVGVTLNIPQYSGGGGASWGGITGTLSSQTDLQTALDARLLASNNLSDVASAFSTRANLGLGSVDNTSDASKPVSTAQQTALNLKANLASPTFTGTVTLPAAQVVNGVTLTTGGDTTNFLRADGTYAAPAGGGGVSSVFTRSGAVVAASGDYTTLQVTESTNLYHTNARAFSAAFPLGLFGDGSDGNVTISSGTTTLTRDMFYANLTMSGTGVLATAGFKVYINGTLDLSAAAVGAIINNGGNGGAGATAGTAGTAATAAGQGTTNAFGSSNAPGAGGTAAGAAAGGAGSATNFAGGMPAGGAGGLGSGGAGGAGTTAAAAASAGVSFKRYIAEWVRASAGAVGLYATSRLSGGGGGGGDGTAGGGGGASGACGGVVAIYARTIARGTNTNVGIIRANGGNGGNGGSAIAGNRGGGGAGTGGAGGMVYICFAELTGSTIVNALEANGGTGGTGGNGFGTGIGGNGGGRGGSGRIVTLNVLTAVGAESVPDSGAAGGAAAGVTGGAGLAATNQRRDL